MPIFCSSSLRLTMKPKNKQVFVLKSSSHVTLKNELALSLRKSLLLLKPVPCKKWFRNWIHFKPSKNCLQGQKTHFQKNRDKNCGRSLNNSIFQSDQHSNMKWTLGGSCNDVHLVDMEVGSIIFFRKMHHNWFLAVKSFLKHLTDALTS